MGQKSGPVKKPAEQVVKKIRRATRRQFTAEEKIRILLSGLRGEDSIAELCRRERIVQNLYYRVERVDAPGKSMLSMRWSRGLVELRQQEPFSSQTSVMRRSCS
jgi:transposase-like protein